VEDGWGRRAGDGSWRAGDGSWRAGDGSWRAGDGWGQVQITLIWFNLVRIISLMALREVRLWTRRSWMRDRTRRSWMRDRTRRSWMRDRTRRS